MNCVIIIRIILNKYRQLLIKNVSNKSKEELLKFLELFSSMNILVSEIKDFSNKVLKKIIFVIAF